jgi:hypothetical protein
MCLFEPIVGNARSQQILGLGSRTPLSHEQPTVQVSATPTCTRLVYSWCLTCTEWCFVRRGKSHVTLNALRVPAHSEAALSLVLCLWGCCRDLCFGHVSAFFDRPEILISL